MQMLRRRLRPSPTFNRAQLKPHYTINCPINLYLAPWLPELRSLAFAVSREPRRLRERNDYRVASSSLTNSEKRRNFLPCGAAKIAPIALVDALVARLRFEILFDTATNGRSSASESREFVPFTPSSSLLSPPTHPTPKGRRDADSPSRIAFLARSDAARSLRHERSDLHAWDEWSLPRRGLGTGRGDGRRARGGRRCPPLFEVHTRVSLVRAPFHYPFLIAIAIAALAQLAKLVAKRGRAGDYSKLTPSAGRSHANLPESCRSHAGASREVRALYPPIASGFFGAGETLAIRSIRFRDLDCSWPVENRPQVASTGRVTSIARQAIYACESVTRAAVDVVSVVTEWSSTPRFSRNGRERGGARKRWKHAEFQSRAHPITTPSRVR
jgi:hypothetical protein